MGNCVNRETGFEIIKEYNNKEMQDINNKIVTRI